MCMTLANSGNKGADNGFTYFSLGHYINQSLLTAGHALCDVAIALLLPAYEHSVFEVNSMPADAVAPNVTSTSADMILPV